jgi:hypothetical protein
MKKRNESNRKRTPVRKRRQSGPQRSRHGRTAPAQQNFVESKTERVPQERDSVPQVPAFRINSDRKRYLTITGVVLIGGVLSMYFYINILLTLRNFYTLLFVIPLYGYVFGDLLLWMWSGVRAVEMDSSGLTIIRSFRQTVQRLAFKEISALRVTSSIDGKTVDLLLRGATSRKFLWMYFDSGPRVRIPAGPFAKKDFAEFIQRATERIPVSPLAS